MKKYIFYINWNYSWENLREIKTEEELWIKGNISKKEIKEILNNYFLEFKNSFDYWYYKKNWNYIFYFHNFNNLDEYSEEDLRIKEDMLEIEKKKILDSTFEDIFWQLDAWYYFNN